MVKRRRHHELEIKQGDMFNHLAKGVSLQVTKWGLRHVSKWKKSKQKEIPLSFDKSGSVMS